MAKHSADVRVDSFPCCSHCVRVDSFPCCSHCVEYGCDDFEGHDDPCVQGCNPVTENHRDDLERSKHEIDEESEHDYGYYPEN